jgi:hypothetical protein
MGSDGIDRAVLCADDGDERSAGGFAAFALSGHEEPGRTTPKTIP